MSTHLESFHSWLQTMGYSKASLKMYPRIVERLFEHAKKQSLEQLTALDIQTFVTHQKTREIAGKRLSGNYINTQLCALRIFGRYLMKMHQIDFPLGNIKNVKPEPRQIRPLTVEEVELLYQATDNTKWGFRDRVMLGMTYAAGLRRKEAANLRVEDVDLKRGFVHVVHGKNNRERQVPIPPRVVYDVKQYLAKARPLLQNGKRYQKALFLSEKGNLLNDQTFEKRLRMLVERTENKRLQQKRVTLHLLRHSIATHLLQAGTPLERVSQFLGHHSLVSTQCYTHVKPET